MPFDAAALGSSKWPLCAAMSCRSAHQETRVFKLVGTGGACSSVTTTGEILFI